MSNYDIDVKQLLEAGAHFGHKSSRWHPKMAPYIHSKREGNHIIDLTKTAVKLAEALDFIAESAQAGKQILLVSTKRQAKEKIKEVASATGMPYVSERWLGGLLTNQATIGARVKRLKDLENRMESGELAAKYSKLEVQKFGEEIENMNHLYGGIKEMVAKPGVLFIVDVCHDDTALKEANKLHIPVVAITDSNADPSMVKYPIPANDDATKTINLVLDYVQKAILDGKNKLKKPATEEKETEKTKKPATKK